MSSDLYRYIDEVASVGRTDDSVIKIVSAAEAIMALPVPSNVRRSRDLVVDVPIKIILSNSTAMPKRIARLVEGSKSKLIFEDEPGLIGLCLSGRRARPEIFVHKGLLDTMDNPEEIFEETFFHEYLHAAEGLKEAPLFGFVRTMPWSFRLQRELFNMDRRTNDETDLDEMFKDERTKKYVEYILGGADLQQNVSEMFAGVGVLLLRRIRTGGNVPRTGEEVYDLLAEHKITSNIMDYYEATRHGATRVDREAEKIWLTRAFHGVAARELVWDAMPAAFIRSARLYGCVV